MSLTATLLLNQPIQLPTGRAYAHRMDFAKPIEISAAQVNYRAENTKTREENIEKVFSAIAEGNQTTADIESETCLSKSTVHGILHQLEDWPGGGRITRIREGHRPHRFHVNAQEEA